MPYKVVEKQTRHCSNWTLYKTHPKQDNRAYKYRKNHPEWFPRYFKGRIVKEVPGSIGILCFEFKVNALNFIRSYSSSNINWLTIQVKGINKREKVQFLISGCGCFPMFLTLGNIGNQHNTTVPPQGTVAYREVLVLE